MLYGDRAPPERPCLITNHQRSVVQEQISVALKLGDAGMDGEAVPRRAG